MLLDLHKSKWYITPYCLSLSPAVDCLPLIAPEHGRIEYESPYPGPKTYGTVATVHCVTGYEVVGTKQAFCTRYGTWDIKLPLPVCRRKWFSYFVFEYFFFLLNKFEFYISDTFYWIYAW